MHDHLGNPITPGACLAYAYDSPMTENGHMCYAMLQEIKPSKARQGAHIFSVITIPAFQSLSYSLNYVAGNPNKYNAKRCRDVLKKQGLKNPNLFTVVDFMRIPDEYQRGWELVEQIIMEGADNFQQRITAQGHL